MTQINKILTYDIINNTFKSVGDACAVVVNQRVGGRVYGALMHQPSRVFFHMNSANPNFFPFFANVYVEEAVHSKRNPSSFVVLGNLEVFWHVWVIVVFSEKEHALRDCTV